MDKKTVKNKKNAAFATREIDILQLWKTVCRRLWVVALSAVLCAVTVLLGTLMFVTPKYQASTMIYVNNSSISVKEDLLDITTGDIAAAKSLVDTYIVILNSRSCLNEIKNYAEVEYSVNELRSMISADAVNDTEVFEVVVTGTDPVETKQIAVAVAEILPRKISKIIEGTSAEIVDDPVVPTSPSSPNVLSNFLLGFMVGAAISFAVIVLIEIFDNSIRGEDDITQICDYPILASVPDMKLSAKGGYRSKNLGEVESVLGEDLSFAATEAYKLLRTKIQFAFADDKDCYVIGVSSALLGEGKSVTSVNLAYSLAQLGKRVLLVDCDMRRPSVAEKMNIDNVPGLSNYLANKISVDEILRHCENTIGDATFDVITAGQNPPNPVELLDSAKMGDILSELCGNYDYIILDLAPVGEVSDALVASKLIDGMVIVTSQDYCNRGAFKNAVEQFEFVDAHILGVVMNRVSDKGHGYGYKKRYKGYNQYSGHKS